MCSKYLGSIERPGVITWARSGVSVFDGRIPFWRIDNWLRAERDELLEPVFVLSGRVLNEAGVVLESRLQGRMS